MSKLLHFINAIILYCGCFVFFLFFIPSFTVKASDFTLYDDPGIASVYLGIDYGSGVPNTVIERQSGTPHSCYYYNLTGTRASCMLLTFDIDDSNIVPSNNIKSYSYNFNGVDHTIYYSVYGAVADYWIGTYVTDFSGTQQFSYSLQNDSQCQAVCNYFLFGVGSLDYDKPAQDIEDSSLDIVGLIGSSSTSMDTDPNTLSGFMSNFVKNVLNLFSGGLFAGSLGSGDIFSSSVPSCRLVWDSPSVSTINDYGDSSSVNYSIWIDGNSKISLYQAGEWIDGTSCSYSHLVLHDDPILYNGTSTFYYSTGGSYQTILNYVLNNATFSGGTSITQAQQSDIKLETCISRIYIQAHKIDDNGDNHLGAISYVDFSSGYPVVFEGVTDSIGDITPDDSGNGTNTIVTQPFVVSGDSIIYGDTVTENNTINNYYGEGLQIGGNIPFLNAAYWLIQAVLELIKTLYASLLVPFIVLGWTGHI